MEVVQEVDIDNIQNIIIDYIENLLINENIDINNIKPMQWDYILINIYRDIIKPNVKKLLKDEIKTHNEYDYIKVLNIYNIYKYIVLKYSICDISLHGFCEFSGIDKQSIYNWASASRFDLHEKIMSDNEQCLEQMLKDKSLNPMKILPILNRRHGWALPHVTKETSKKELIAREDIQAISENKQTLLPEID